MRPAPLLGLIDEAVYRDASVALRPGNALVLISDGVTECFDFIGHPYGEERLMRRLAAAGSGAPEQVLADLVAELDVFPRGCRPPTMSRR